MLHKEELASNFSGKFGIFPETEMTVEEARARKLAALFETFSDAPPALPAPCSSLIFPILLLSHLPKKIPGPGPGNDS